MSYLVYAAAPMTRSWAEACGERIEGVLVVRARGLQINEGKARLDAEAELYRCDSGELLWRASAEDSAQVADENLKELTQSYVRQLGPDAAPVTPVSFLVVRALFDTLPDTSLSDDEVMEKIELGRAAGVPRPASLSGP